ncbi:MAG TPA: TetR-like C-terminal domain-containing protein [Nocardioides sp.]
MTTRATSRRERHREATYDDIVRVAKELLAAGQQPSLRSVAAGVGLTAPALYRYVASYQDLVDLVAYEIDKEATGLIREAADAQPDDDPAARLVAAVAAFRRWALTNPREFSMVFANPIAEGACVRRELLTSATSGHYMNGLMLDLWDRYRFPHPDVDELPAQVRESVMDPVLPIDVSLVPDGHRGLLWVFMRAWASLYGVVTLEVFGHMDPRVIESGELFAAMMMSWMEPLGLAPERDRLETLLRAELTR